MLDLFFLFSTAVGQLNPIRTISPLVSVAPIPRTTLSRITSTTTLSTSTFLLTTQPSDDDQVTRDAIIVGSIWGVLTLIILFVCCKKKKNELEPIVPASLEYVKEKSYSSHIYEEVDNHPYEMPVIREDEIYGAQVTAL